MFVTRSQFFSFAVAVVVTTLSFASARAQEAENETLPYPIVAQSDSGAYHAINQLPESIRSSAPFAREFFEFARHAGSSGTVDYDACRSTFAQAQQDMLRSKQAAFMGKNTPQNIQGTWSNIGLTGGDSIPTAGITTAIVFDPQHVNIMYAGGSGGVWKSYDTGAHWSPLTDDQLPNLSVATIAIDPVMPDTLYIGTGFCYNALVNYGGTGLYRSMDGGTTFKRLSVPTGESFVKVVVDPDPAKHNIVLASSFDQQIVYRSTNSGGTWSSVFSTGETWDIIATPGNAGVFYLICTGGIYKSTNDGSTWTKSAATSTFFNGSIGRAALASPTNVPNKIVALMTDAATNGQNYLAESTNAGTSWTLDNSIPGGLFTIPGSTIFHPQGWYDLYVAITPNSLTDDTIYAGGVFGFEKSGGNWSEFSDYSSGHQSGGNGYPHSDHHGFAINPLHSNTVYDGDDGGLWINYAAGSNDVQNTGGWQLHSANMVTNRFYHFSFDKNNIKATWTGAQDQGIWKISQGLPPATYSPLGDGLQALVSSQNSNHVYAEGPAGEIYQATLPGGWSLIADSAQGVNDQAPGWDAPFKMASASLGGISGSSILYVGRQHLWQSTNGGTNWSKKSSPGFGSTYDGVYEISAIGLPSWNDSVIYVAGGSSSFQLSTDFGNTWHARTNPGTVTEIVASYKDPKFVLVSLEGSKNKVMMSEDSGHSWTNVSGLPGANIPGADTNTACNVLCVAIDSSNPLTTWYAATDYGVYQTADAGQHWSWMGPGLFPCRDVQIASNGVTMRVSTYGRGIWEVQLPIQFSGVESTTLSATRSASETNLAWNVEGEPNGAMFYVERSVDGDAFARIGSVAGSGASPGTQNYSFADNTTTPGTYLYQIHEIDANGAEHYSNRVELHYGTNQLYLYQPYPNPFILGGNSSNAVTLNFEIPTMDQVQLRIYDVKGTLIRTLLNRTMDGGPQSTIWDARDDQGNPVAPGAYFYSIQTATSGMASGKIMMVRE